MDREDRIEPLAGRTVEDRRSRVPRGATTTYVYSEEQVTPMRTRAMTTFVAALEPAALGADEHPVIWNGRIDDAASVTWNRCGYVPQTETPRVSRDMVLLMQDGGGPIHSHVGRARSSRPPVDTTSQSSMSRVV